MECDTDDLYQQGRFHRLCIERIHKFPPTLKQNKWRDLIDKLLTNLEVIDAPDDAGPVGQFGIHLENFCMGRAHARTKDELLMGKVFVDEGYIYFRSSDLFKYLDQQHFRDFKQHKVWAIVRSNYEAGKKEFRIKGRHVRTWCIPEFQDKQTDELDTVHIPSVF
jgi:hypothetical protein